jgi:hypothetical protein
VTHINFSTSQQQSLFGDDEIKMSQSANDYRGYVSVKEIAQFIGVSSQHVGQLTRDGVIKSEKVPGQPGMMYNFLPTVRSLLAFYKERSKGKNEAVDEAKLNQIHIKNRSMQAKLELQEGNAHSIQTIERIWGDVIGSFKVMLNSMPEMEADRVIDIQDRATAVKTLKGIATNLSNLLLNYDAAGFSKRNPDIGLDEEDDMIDEDYFADEVE